MKAVLLGLCFLWGSILSLNSHAYPMLSADGSLLTGVEAGGQLYDVMFGDAVLGDIYPASVVGQPGWFDLANAIKQGIVDALNALPILPTPGDIQGCDGVVAQGWPPGCLILIPDQLFGSGPSVRFGDSNAAGLSPTEARRDSVTRIITVLDTYDTSDYGQLTFAQFRLAHTDIPVPGSLTLIMLALFAARFFHLRAS
ncbi:MAG: hypothetical protein R3E64_04270 [Halioglobus sp.]